MVSKKEKTSGFKVFPYPSFLLSIRNNASAVKLQTYTTSKLPLFQDVNWYQNATA